MGEMLESFQSCISDVVGQRRWTTARSAATIRGTALTQVGDSDSARNSNQRAVQGRRISLAAATNAHALRVGFL